MTSTELERIAKRHEMRRLEFKESFGVECIETACAFANAEGGLIVIGVDDHGERVKKPLRFEALRDYENRITTATEPSVAIEAEKFDFGDWDYPLEAIRETVANAVCHRDYGIANDIQLKIAEDRLRVWSPGALPFDAPMDVIMNPDHCSHPRNKLIAQVFYDMGIIERYGSGIERIREECAKGGYAQPVWKEVEGGFATVYRTKGDGAINGAVSGAINGGEKLDGVLADVYRLILANPGVKTDSIIGSLKIGSSTVDRAVKRLKGMNLVQYKGSRKTGGYFAAEVGSKGEM